MVADRSHRVPDIKRYVRVASETECSDRAAFGIEPRLASNPRHVTPTDNCNPLNPLVTPTHHHL